MGVRSFIPFSSLRVLVAILFTTVSGAVVTLGQSSSIGLDPSKKFLQYVIQSWQKRDGLPQNSVNSMVQTKDGYLWLATQEGLVRFDGVRFQVFSPKTVPGMLSKFVLALLQREDGTLWVATFGGGVSVFRNGSLLATYTSENGLPSDYTTALFEDDEQKLWVGTAEGLASLVDSTFVPVGRPLRINAIGQRKGTILVGTPIGIFSKVETGLAEFSLPIPGYVRVRKIFEGGKDTLWIATASHGLLRLAEDVRIFSKRDGLSSNVIGTVLQDRRGTVWVGTLGEGIYRIVNGHVESLETEDPLSNVNVISMLEDHEGNLWLGTYTNGLHRVANGKFTTFQMGKGSSRNTVWTLHADRENNLYAGTGSGEIFRFTGNDFYPFFDFHKSVNVSCIVRDRSGILWVVAGNTLSRIQNGTMEIPFPRLRGVVLVFEDSRGTLWVGTGTGLYRIVNGIPRLFPDSRDVKTGLVTSLTEDRNGQLWLGSSSGSLFRIRGDRIQEVYSYGPNPVVIGSMYADDEGVVWMGTFGRGLQFYRGDSLTTITVSDGLYDEYVYSILEDDNGFLWMSCNNGIYRVSKKRLLERPSGKEGLEERVFGENDGMKTSECNGGQSTAIRTSDGRLWFATIEGIAMVHPGTMPLNTAVPPVVIERFTVNQESRDLSAAVVEAGARDFEIDYAAMSFMMPERTNFRYRLHGFESKWIEAGQRRFASYTNIPPGSYRFQVIASNNDGQWNTEGASFEFSVKPFFYQTFWFKGVMGLLVVFAMVGSFHMYGNYQKKRIWASEMETQLARAQLHALRSQLQPHFLFNTLNGISVLVRKDPEAAREMISRLSNLLRLTLEHRESQEVPLRKELEILDAYLSIVQKRFHNRLSVEFDISKSMLNAMVPTFILQPLVENSIKHGVSKIPGPSVIRISGAKERGSLSLSVWDSGTNVRKTDIQEGIGLSNTKARLTRLYGTRGTLEILGGYRKGFEVVLRIPYRKSLNSSGKRTWTELDS